MKNLIILFFLLSSILGFGQDCDCMKEINVEPSNRLMIQVLPDADSFPKGKIFINLLEKEFDRWLIYIINRTDTTFVGDCNNFYFHPKITLEAKDSLGEWRAITYQFLFADCIVGDEPNCPQELPPNHYAYANISLKRSQTTNFKTTSRFAIQYKNQTFYSELFINTINYCDFGSHSFRKGLYTLRDSFNIMNMNEECILNNASNIQIFEFTKEDDYAVAMKIIDVLSKDEFSKIYAKAVINEDFLRYNSSCYHHIESLLRNYVKVWLDYDGYEAIVNYDAELDEKEMKQQYAAKEKLEKYYFKLPTKSELSKTNYKNHIEIINGEEYFKIDCLDGTLVKVRFRER